MWSSARALPRLALSTVDCQRSGPDRFRQRGHMPTYEYRCKSCEHQFDIVQAFSDDALTVCPECDGPLKKVFGNVGITFKGSGFYKTDSRSAGSFGSAKDADRTDAKKGAEADAKPKADTKTDSSSGSGDKKASSDKAGSSASGSGSSSGSGSGNGSSGSGSSTSSSSSGSTAKT